MIFFSARLSRPLQKISHRHLSSASPQHSIYLSKSTNPYFNLTFEDWLFRHKTPSQPLLLIYRDDPCVIIGRNQNPWKEINFDALKSRPGIPFIRRRSGGGTVYHDLGNTNFSIHQPRRSFDRHLTAQVILRAVRSLNIDASLNDRNDICVGHNKICLAPFFPYDLTYDFVIHVSGSAYKIVNTRAYHHGTMLISTRLADLGDILRTNKETMISKGVASVRSPVCNLRQFNTHVDHLSFSNAVVNEFRREYGIDEKIVEISESEEWLSLPYIKQGMSELPSWQWAYGQTPEFKYTIDNSFSWGKVSANIISKHGVILSCTLNLIEPCLSTNDAENVFRLAKSLEGRRYGCDDDDTTVGIASTCTATQSVWTWLQTAMV
ncbi:hypothetical protein AGABI1DRAFT_72757 [Agaricus bisporus var. burnettii JB137-S8]|uniref:Putative lipoate-protein ligase A n=1 Tax=Agaricus bisporus var. burnettii (strain JB137-S8 / ATCC MYA-4627 / FGSC 10392) TaxID=597362 RepID=K5VZP2_AGABU|nr:uncharacterized protein AGABI1DRAFT_72757 [Agaricus bisporus var. burnettii JB137-S8]EKM79994.1 hypothetical protein AGABI1DRAFT_72757 [Agaricus bisporus var. burnettii JB137-S8]